MDARKKAELRKQVNRLFRSNPEGSVIELLVNDKVIGEYEIPQNHYVTLDSKTPLDWLNQTVCFEVDLKGIKNAKISVRMRKPALT